MLHIIFGSTDKEVYDTATYFIHQYEDEWITDDLSREMIKDVDKSSVIDTRVIESPVLGMITPRELSGGVKTLILMHKDDSGRIFNASACGDNCAKWILRMAENKELYITLHNLMDFGQEPFEAYIENSKVLVKNYKEYAHEAFKYI